MNNCLEMSENIAMDRVLLTNWAIYTVKSPSLVILGDSVCDASGFLMLIDTKYVYAATFVN